MGDDNTLHFKTNIQLKSIIGKDLINDDNIAILELVKNSFDADAKKVEVQYFNLKNNDDRTTESFSELTSRLIIKDNGLGMGLDDIKDKWLNIAYSEKKSNNRQHNRMMAGAKGVGRFSCDRLGEYLNLYTKKQNSTDYLLLKIDWKKFEIDDTTKEIQSIDLIYETLTKTELIDRNIQPFNQGVLLEIIKLRSNWVYQLKDNKGKNTGWNTDKLVYLKKYLEKLINPNQAYEKNDFGIYLDAIEFKNENSQKVDHEKFIGKIENTIFEKLDFKTTSIESEIIEDGRTILTTLKDKGQTIFWIKEKNIYFPLIKNAKLTFYYLSTYSKSFFTKQTGIQSVQYGSIFLFINGFRIPPYGEVGDDWLGLDQRKNQGTARYIGLREVVGSIEILDNENNFRIISSREGIVKNDNYNRLTNSKGNNSFIFKAYRRLERFVVDGLDWDSAPEDLKDKFKEIEKKIISGEVKENDLIFRENDVTKKRRVYETIHTIIGAKLENVIELYINEDLILDKVQEEKLNSEREFEQLISDFENKKIDGETLNRILQRKALDNINLEKQINDLSRYNTNDATTKAIAELQIFKNTIEKQTQIIEDLKNQLEKEKLKQQEQEQLIENLKTEKEKSDFKARTESERRIIAEEEKEKALKFVENVTQDNKEKEKVILFQQKLLTKEVIELIEFHHVIGISADTIDKHLINLQEDLSRGRMPSKEDLNDLIDCISYESKKITSLTNLATSANFSADADEIDTDLYEFIKQYSKNLSLKTSNGNSLILNIHEDYLDFLYHFKPIEIAIILDNLFSNSIKAKANSIDIKFKKNDETNLSVYISDNGIGIKKENADKIFGFGYTTTSGSGMGLHHIKKIIENNYNSTISYNANSDNGSEFVINFKK